MRKLMVLLMVMCLMLGGFAVAEGQEPEIVILYTNDVHCAIDDNLGYARVAGLRDELEAAGKTVFVVDAGDAVQGGPIGTLSKGEYIINIMNKVGYDVMVPGNHEFDYGMDRFFELVEMANFDVISANFVDITADESKLYASVTYEVGDMKIGFLGISTPKTITSSTPAYFQNEAGEFIYGFMQDTDGAALYEWVQGAVDALRAEADMVVVLGHLGIDDSCSPWMSSELIVNTNGIDIFIDGHSHSEIPQEFVKNKDGKDVLLTSSGTKINNIGMVEIAGGKVASQLVTEAPVSADVEAYIAEIRTEFDGLLNTIVASTNVDLVISDPETGVRIVRNAETNLGDLCADGYRTLSGADAAFVNGGGVRAVITAGDITYGQILNVHPFGNAMCMVKTTGQQILDALEMGARNVPDENGGFLQVSGVTYEIHTYVPSSVVLDENGLFSGVTGEYRVKNVTIGGEALVLDKEYTLASHNYMLKNGGDGFTMFKNDEVILDEVMLDNQVLITYITEVLNGVVGEEYANPYGEGRIVAVAEKAE